MPEARLTPWTPVPILMYHAVEDATRPPNCKHLYVTTSEFRAQMHALKARGHTAITFDHLRDARAGVKTLPAKPIILTFDDGYQNLRANAHPVLKELGFPYTVFLVSSLIGKTNEWVAAEGMEPTPLLTWDEIREMHADGGVSFQPHTITHPHLAEIAPTQARQEMAQSRDVLQQELQTPMDVFCYPFGSVNETVARLAGEIGYTRAVTTQFGRVRSGDDPLRLPRVSIYHVPPFSLTYGIGSLNFIWRVESRKDTRP